MKSQVNLKVLRGAVASALIFGCSLVVMAATPGNAEQIALYMHQARIHAAQAGNDLALLRTYSMAGVPWQVHFNRLQQVEDDLNALVKDCDKLKTLRDGATPEQIRALDRLDPMARDVVVHVKSTLRFLNYHSAAVNMPPFIDRVRAESASVQIIFGALCQCARTKSSNTTLVASNNLDRTAVADCSTNMLTAKR